MPKSNKKQHKAKHKKELKKSVKKELRRRADAAVQQQESYLWAATKANPKDMGPDDVLQLKQFTAHKNGAGHVVLRGENTKEKRETGNMLLADWLESEPEYNRVPSALALAVPMLVEFAQQVERREVSFMLCQQPAMKLLLASGGMAINTLYERLIRDFENALLQQAEHAARCKNGGDSGGESEGNAGAVGA